MKIAIFGLGHVGLTSAGCLLREGHDVIGIDSDGAMIAELVAGRSPFSEPGLDDLLRAGFAGGRLRVSSATDAAWTDCDLVIACVGTPNAADGSYDLSQVVAASQQIAAELHQSRPGAPIPVVFRSTMWPGSVERVISPIFAEAIGKGMAELVYNPEFMRESSAVDDYFNPARIVLGTADGRVAPESVLKLYANIKAPVFVTTFGEAELIKLVDNAWHAVKVGYANEVGRMCLQLGISAARLHDMFVADTKLNISAYYTRPGGPFGGPCLEKDVRALATASSRLGVDAAIVSSAIASNEAHKRFLFSRCIKGLRPGARVLMIGLGYKPGSDDLRDSPKVELARKFLDAGFGLSIYDPYVGLTRMTRNDAAAAMAVLPGLKEILVTAAEAEASEYDLVVDTFGWSDRLKLKAPARVDLHALA